MIIILFVTDIFIKLGNFKFLITIHVFINNFYIFNLILFFN